MPEFEIHTDYTNGYRIKYPADWRPQTLSPDTMGFFAPQDNDADIFLENVNIGVEDTQLLLNQYVDVQVAQLKAAGSFQFISRENTYIAGLPAQKLEFNGQLGPSMQYGRLVMLPVQWLFAIVVKNCRAYVITYTAQQHMFETCM